jgi:hypothetical protein
MWMIGHGNNRLIHQVYNQSSAEGFPSLSPI